MRWGVVLVMSLLFLLGEDLHLYCGPDDPDGRMDVPVLQGSFEVGMRSIGESVWKSKASACPHRKQAGICSTSDVNFCDD